MSVNSHRGMRISPAESRTTGQLLRDGLGHIQEILRSEVRLAKAEIREEGRTAAQAAALGGLALFFLGSGASFLLWAAFWALSNELPRWAAAALLAGFALTLGASIGWTAYQRFRSIQSANRTKHTLKENVEWARSRMQ